MNYSYRTFSQVDEAYRFLQELGANDRLLRHVALVGEAAELLIGKLQELGLTFDEQFVRLGVALHDAGKILHPDELDKPGNCHEVAGQQLLLHHNLAPHLARCCVSHGQWRTMDALLKNCSSRWRTSCGKANVTRN